MGLFDQDNVPIDDGTASNEAFDKTFRVGVQNRFLNTPEILKMIGVPTTGDRQLDSVLQQRYVTILATPIACVEYYEMGAGIKFYDTTNAGKILKILQTHVANWNWLMRNRYNIDRPPQEELEQIVGFCDVLAKFAGSVENTRGGIMGSKRLYMTGDNDKGTGNSVFNRRSLYKEEPVNDSAAAKGSSLRKAFMTRAKG